MVKKGTQAVKPEMFNLRSYIKEESEKDIEELTDDEKVLASGADQRFWLILRQHINNELERLDQINEQAISNGMPLTEIGQNTIVMSYVKGIVETIFKRVEDAKEAMEQSGSK